MLIPTEEQLSTMISELTGLDEDKRILVKAGQYFALCTETLISRSNLAVLRAKVEETETENERLVEENRQLVCIRERRRDEVEELRKESARLEERCNNCVFANTVGCHCAKAAWRGSQETQGPEIKT